MKRYLHPKTYKNAGMTGRLGQHCCEDVDFPKCVKLYCFFGVGMLKPKKEVNMFEHLEDP